VPRPVSSGRERGQRKRLVCHGRPCPAVRGASRVARVPRPVLSGRARGVASGPCATAGLVRPWMEARSVCVAAGFVRPWMGRGACVPRPALSGRGWRRGRWHTGFAGARRKCPAGAAVVRGFARPGKAGRGTSVSVSAPGMSSKGCGGARFRTGRLGDPWHTVLDWPWRAVSHGSPGRPVAHGSRLAMARGSARVAWATRGTRFSIGHGARFRTAGQDRPWHTLTLHDGLWHTGSGRDFAVARGLRAIGSAVGPAEERA